MTVNIHGKEYTTVHERIILVNKATSGKYHLTSERLDDKDGVVSFKSTLIVDRDGKEYTYNGHCSEIIGSTQINKNNALENAETGARGRALEAAGFGGNEGASAEEVANALVKGDSSSNPVSKFNGTMPFGKDKGKKLNEVSEQNLKWIVSNLNKPHQEGLVDTCREELKRRANG